MSKVRLTGSTSGYTEIQASAVAGDNTLSLPTTTDGTLLAADSSGNVNLDNGTLYVDAANNRVGVGTTSPGSTLDVAGTIKSNNGVALELGSNAAIRDTTNGGSTIFFDVATGGTAHGAFDFRSSSAFTSRLYISTAGNVGIGLTTSPTYKLELSTDSAGKPSTNTWTIVSDERIKEDIELADLDICYDAIKNIPLKRFKWKDEVYTEEQVPDRNKLGWIAQDVEQVFPKAVQSKEFKYGEEGNEVVIPDCRDLNADQLYAAMYGAIQKLIAKVETLEAANTDLAARITALEAN